MEFSSLSSFLSQAPKLAKKAPVCLIFAEDDVELASSIRHHIDLGFAPVVVFASLEVDVPEEVKDDIVLVHHDLTQPMALENTVNACISAMPAVWMYYCYNAEYLLYPFCEHRQIGEMLAFHTEERRASMLTYVVDLYAKDLDQHPNAVSLENAMLDKSGYYALARPDRDNHNHPKERQLDFFGGLRWRFEEHVPATRRRIDRISIFFTKPGLTLRADHTFSDEEYNTYSCPWHHNLSAAVASFRTAKALRSNPGSRHEIHSFLWYNSIPFEWHSQQLLDLGLMEPGQWF